MSLPSETSTVHGYAAPGFASVIEAFERNFAERGELGAAFAAVVDGEVVVDLWGGVADRRRGIAWREDTLVPVFSGTKGLVATCLLLLLERGALALDTPAARWWPQYAAAGKGATMVRDLVCHRAGLPGLTTAVTIAEATDDVRMAALVAAQAPIAPPGAGPLYHAMTFGWLCGELVRRASGRSVGRVFADDVAAPLGLEAWIGLPAAYEPRVARVERGAGFTRAHAAVTGSGGRGDGAIGREAADGDAADGSVADPVVWSIWSNPPRFADGELAANRRDWHAAEVPATNGIATARALARLYGCLARGGELDGVRLLAPATIAAGTRCLARGHDPYLDQDVAFATGFQVQTGDMVLGPAPDAFGHPGAGGSVHGAWPGLRTGFSYTPNLLGGFAAVDPRAAALLGALYAAVAARGSVPGEGAAARAAAV